MNFRPAAESIKFCVASGVQEFIVCAGARNAPLVEMLAEAAISVPGLKVHSFFDERAAGFFALGRMEESRRPVAVLTTSGTAVAELLPAVVESYYQGRPLVVVSADRPKHYRGTGSPQSIEQNRIFGSYAEHCLDLETDFSSLVSCAWSGSRPIHLNICFEEPQSHPLNTEQVKRLCAELASLSQLASAKDRMSSEHQGAPSLSFGKNTLWILGPLSGHERGLAKKLLQSSSAPIWAESLSGLSGDTDLKNRLLYSEAQLEQLLASGVIEQVVRVGTVPTLRLWRDLEGVRKGLPVLNIVPARAPWSGLSRPSRTLILEECATRREVDGVSSEVLSEVSSEATSEAFSLAAISSKVLKLKDLFSALAEKYPGAEPVLLDRLSSALAADKVYVGNSLPVRYWDWISSGRSYRDIYGNRGANGIDGQLATFMGWSATSGASWALVGDLTALYDLNALAVARPTLSEEHSPKRRIVVINNGGGMIFKKIFGKELFLNRHDTRFAGWAQMFGWHYEEWAQIPERNLKELPAHTVIELRPDSEQTDAFLKAWQQEAKLLLGVS